MARVLFWLKLPKDFFRQKEIKKLRTIAGGDTYTIGNSGPITLFGAAGGQLKLYDALDRLSLTANWAPASSQITIIYWTENVQESGSS